MTTEPYRESEHHVPRATDVVAQLDTSGLGGHDKLTDVSPVFKQAAEAETVAASDALRAGDTPEDAGVVLPNTSDPGVDDEDVDRAVEGLHERADAIKAEGGPAAEPTVGTDGQYDPRDHSVGEVTEHLEKSDATERERVLNIERHQGANRKGVTGYQLRS
jgi:hypothetical protein